MVKDQSNECPARSYCEKIYKATFGRLHRNSHYLKKNDVSSPSLSTTGYATDNGHYVPLEVKPFKKFVPCSSNNVENNRGGGLKSFSEEKCNSYIDGVKKKMSAPSGFGGGPTVSSDDSFNGGGGLKSFSEEKYNSYIDGVKKKMSASSDVDGF